MNNNTESLNDKLTAVALEVGGKVPKENGRNILMDTKDRRNVVK